MSVLCTPLRVEHAALGRAGHDLRLVRCGMGPRRAAATAARLPANEPVLVAGVAAAQTPHICPGDIVVATEVRGSALMPPSSTSELFNPRQRTLLSNSAAAGLARRIEIPTAALLAGALRRLGLRVHVGAISSVPRIARRPLADGSLAVDMESAQLAVEDRPFAVIRAIVDTPDHPLWHVGTLRRGVRALRSLRACRPALEWWAAATGPREVLLADLRPVGAGVVPAVSTADHQPAVRAVARKVDLMLVVGSPSSLSLVEMAQREGVPAHLIRELSEIDLRWLTGRLRLGILIDTCAPPQLIPEIVHCLGGLGRLTVRESQLLEKDLTNAAPEEVS
jgi:4-hydroxy-3-methylbut-2-en-1-yl diphosphate reductase